MLSHGLADFVIQFYPWFKFSFLLFLGIVMYNSEFETKENKIWTKIKLNHSIYIKTIIYLGG